MRSAAVSVVIVLTTVGAHAQQKHPAATTMPPPPPVSPFAAGPNTYAPRYGRLMPLTTRGSFGAVVPIYGGTYGMTSSPPAESKAAPPATEPAPPALPAPEPTKPAEPVPGPPPIVAAHGPDTFYVIPGCYAGNRPPIPERLPKGCDPAKMRTTPIR